MNVDKLLKILASAALAALIGFAAVSRAGTEAKPAVPKTEAKPDPKAEAKKASPRQVEIKVTDKGYEPTPITVKKGEPLRLRITRTTEETCAKDIILPDYGIETELPMNKPVDVEFTPTKGGKLKYGCSMGMMIAGVLIVE
jgi:plastocyanin domain-containing protein